MAVVILNSLRMQELLILVILNQTKVVEFSIAYCPVRYDLQSESFRQVLVHEAVGHGLPNWKMSMLIRKMGLFLPKK